MIKSVIHPKFSDSLDRFKNQTIDIYEPSAETGDYGEPVITWTKTSAGVPCRITVKEEGKILQDDKQVVIASHRVAFFIPVTIAEGYEIDWEGDRYEVMLAGKDSEGVIMYCDIRRADHATS